MKNILKAADPYKGEHWNWINPNVDFATGYLEPRVKGGIIQVAGIHALANKLVNEYRVSGEDIEELMEFASRHSFGHAKINRQGWETIAEDFNGYLPVHIKALEEGTVLPTQVPVMMVRNSHPGYAWVIPYFELLWLHLWKTMDVATNSFKQVQLLSNKGRETMPEDVFNIWVDFALHDFGARSTGSLEEAEIGIGHLINSKGSDNWPATALAQDVYTGEFPSYSVLALEHNVVLSYGEDGEHGLFADFAKEVLTTGRIGSMLIDTYDVDAAVDWVIANKAMLENWAAIGDYKGKLVLRPDSGDATDMPVWLLKKLLDNFGYTEYNGYKLLPSWIGVIQGDGNNLARLEKTTSVLMAEKISLANIVFGEGGELINNYKRDDNGWAFKVSMYTMKDGTEVPCAKKPKHSPEKHSKEGYFSYSAADGLTRATSWANVEGYDTYYEAREYGVTLSMTDIESVRSLAKSFI